MIQSLSMSPILRDRSLGLFRDCLDTGWVSTAGHWVKRFEQELAVATGAPYAVAVSNGTVALRLALHLVGVGRGDEVLLPPLSFVATANAISHLGAFPLHRRGFNKWQLIPKPFSSVGEDCRAMRVSWSIGRLAGV